MSKIKNILVILLSFILIIGGMISSCYAKNVELTMENLEKALENFAKLKFNENQFKSIVTDKNIELDIENKKYNINYTLKDVPTFSSEITIKKGMTYEEFKTQAENIALPILGYFTVANVQGVNFEDIEAYLKTSIMMNTLTGAIPLSALSEYKIVDDLNVQDGEKIEKTDDPETIYTSEFGNKVMELVNAIFQKDITISDGTGTNSYAWTIKKEDATADSCKIVSKVTVQPDADFSQLVGYADTEETSDDDNKQTDKKNNTAQEEQKQNTNTDNDKAKTNTDKTNTSTTNTPGKTNSANSNTKIYPKTGFENCIIIAIFSLGIAIIIFGVKNRKYKDIQ